MQYRNHLFQVSAIVILALLITSSLAGAQPGDTPPEGNVDARFHTVRITGTAPAYTFIEGLKVTGQEYQAGEGMGSFTIMNDGEFTVNVPSTSMVSRLIGTFTGKDGGGGLQIFNDGHLSHSTGPVEVRDSMEIGDKYNALAIDNNGHLSDGNGSVYIDDDFESSGWGWVHDDFGVDGGTYLYGDAFIDKSQAQINFGYDVNGSGTNTGPHGLVFTDDNGHGLQLFFRTGDNQVTIEDANDNDEIFFVDADNDEAYFKGKVGIGDTSPDYKLDVAGTINAIDGSATGVALRANTLNAVELVGILVYETTYPVFKWGNGASWNWFPDKVGILTGNPRVALDVDGDVDIGPSDPVADSINDGDELLIADGAPQIEFSDETASSTGEEDDYYIHVNNSRFYILWDDEDVDGNDSETANPEGDWNPPHPLYFHERDAFFSGPLQVGAYSSTYPMDGLIKVISGSAGRTAEFGAEDSDDYLHIGSTTNHSFNIITNGTRRVTVQNDGDVGIGQTSPSARLDITNSTADFPTLELDRVTGTPSIKASDSYLIMDSNGGRTELNRYVDDPVVLAHGGGNVGIGTDSPASQLSIVNNVGSGDSFDTYDDYQLLLYESAAAPQSYGIGIESATMAFNTNNDYKFYQDGGAEAKVTIDDGKVGIATETPRSDTLLDVNGHIIGNSIGEFVYDQGTWSSDVANYDTYSFVTNLCPAGMIPVSCMVDSSIIHPKVTYTIWMEEGMCYGPVYNFTGITNKFRMNSICFDPDGYTNTGMAYGLL
jgi:hypothetical protein